jgi:multicomponent Na+:H+ antiporter subunit G
MIELISAILMLIGVFFMAVAGVGVLRMPDLFLRMSATTKAATLGVSSILLAVAVYSGELGVISRALATIVFVFLTAPIAAHMIGRAAYFVGVPLWSGTISDELHGRYDPRTHELRSVRLADLERQLPDLQFYQFRVGPQSAVVGKTLAEIDLRRQYGVTVLAVLRGALAMDHPGAETQLLVDDEIILVGAPDNLDQVASLFRGPAPRNADGELRR